MARRAMSTANAAISATALIARFGWPPMIDREKLYALNARASARAKFFA
jgi:hypothetical protein